MEVMLPLLQSVGNFPDYHDLSNMMESVLATSSIQTSSLRTRGCISSGPTDLCTFRFLRQFQTCSSPTVGAFFILPVRAFAFCNLGAVAREFAVED